MKHIYRFLAKKETIESNENVFFWIIENDDLHHLVKVLRLQESDIIEVFDGNGLYAKAQILEINPKKFARCKTIHLHKEKKPNSLIALCLGALKSQNIEQVLPSIVELGCDEIHIFMQNNLAKYRFSDKNQQRWEKIILTSCKQCKRNFLPKLKLWPSLTKMIEGTLEFELRILLSSNSQTQLYDMIMDRKTVQLVMGSEKGLDASEEKLLLKAGFEKYSLGQNILRSVTAAISSMTILGSKRYNLKKNKK